jgi:hypothetical protein
MVKIQLSLDDRNLILEHVPLYYPGLREKLEKKRPQNGAISLEISEKELSELLGCVAREANHTSSRKLENELDPLFEYLESVEFQLKCQGD